MHVVEQWPLPSHTKFPAHTVAVVGYVGAPLPDAHAVAPHVPPVTALAAQQIPAMHAPLPQSLLSAHAPPAATCARPPAAMRRRNASRPAPPARRARPARPPVAARTLHAFDWHWRPAEHTPVVAPFVHVVGQWPLPSHTKFPTHID